MITAKIIADSKNEYGQRLTTFVLTFPRIVLAEFNTHRMLSRNSASSRAIPFKKMLKMVQENPFIPIKWMKDHTGMQGNDYFTEEIDTNTMEALWLNQRDRACDMAEDLSNRGLTKQIVNRLLEPFMWHTVIVTASEWENFFALRAHPAAEIHIADLAEKMLVAYNESTPNQLKAGEWHIPFGDSLDWERVLLQEGEPSDNIIKIATARCARVSYLNFEGKDDYEADIKLHDMLLSSGHMSPFEHCAKAMHKYEFDKYHNGVMKSTNFDWSPDYDFMPSESLGWCGNFRGFIQYRKTIAGENKVDPRVKKHGNTATG